MIGAAPKAPPTLGGGLSGKMGSPWGRLAGEGARPVVTGPKPAAGGQPVLGAMHEGGKVPKDGAYELQAGEKVTPAKKEKGKAATAGRDSEYRRVYLKRKKK